MLETQQGFEGLDYEAGRAARSELRHDNRPTDRSIWGAGTAISLADSEIMTTFAMLRLSDCETLGRGGVIRFSLLFCSFRSYVVQKIGTREKAWSVVYYNSVTCAGYLKPITQYLWHIGMKPAYKQLRAAILRICHSRACRNPQECVILLSVFVRISFEKNVSLIAE